MVESFSELDVHLNMFALKQVFFVLYSLTYLPSPHIVSHKMNPIFFFTIWGSKVLLFFFKDIPICNTPQLVTKSQKPLGKECYSIFWGCDRRDLPLSFSFVGFCWGWLRRVASSEHRITTNCWKELGLAELLYSCRIGCVGSGCMALLNHPHIEKKKHQSLKFFNLLLFSPHLSYTFKACLFFLTS